MLTCKKSQKHKQSTNICSDFQMQIPVPVLRNNQFLNVKTFKKWVNCVFIKHVLNL